MIPAGELVTVPEPVPFVSTVSVWVSRSKLATASLAALTVTSHLFEALTVPGQVCQTTAFVLGPGVPVRVIRVPWMKLAWHSGPQLIAAGELVTVPVPEPFLTTVSWWDSRLKDAATVFAAFIVTSH